MSKYGEIFDYRVKGLAKCYIGKQGIFSDYLYKITEHPEGGIRGTLNRIYDINVPDPFNMGRTSFQFFRPILEEEKPELMTNRQLAEWVGQGYGQLKHGAIVSNSVAYSVGDEEDTVDNGCLVRRWDSDEWILPTVDVYEEDCR